MRASAENIPPWDEEAIGSAYTGNCLVAFLWLLLACVLGCLSLAFLLPSLQEIIAADVYPRAPISPYLMLAIGIAICYAAWRALKRMSKISELRRAHILRETSAGSDSTRDIKIVLVPVGLSVGLQGRATAFFDNDTLSIKGVIHIVHPLYNMASLPLIPVGWYLGARFSDDVAIRALALAVVFGVANLSIFLYYRFYCDKLRTDAVVRIRAQDIRKLRCFGPFVRLKLRGSVLRGLSTVYIFVPPNYRHEFFGAFDHTFPKMLPRTYRDALQDREGCVS